MPSPQITCEFCSDKSFRKNELANHIKTKHKPELAKLLLSEWTEKGDNSTIARYAQSKDGILLPIYSRMYEDYEYYFGHCPLFLTSEEGVPKIHQSEDNRKEHYNFVGQIINSISMLDYINQKKDIHCMSEEYQSIRNRNFYLAKKLETLEEKVITLELTNQKQTELIKSHEAQNGSDIPYQELIQYKNQYYFEREKRDEDKLTHKKELLEKDRECNMRIQEIYDNIGKQKVMAETDNYRLQEELDKAKKHLEEQRIKRETLINAEVEKQTKKIEKEAKKQYQQEMEEKEDEIDELRKQIKKLKRSKAKSDDSDSD
jgi:hypothetical protein